MTYEECMEAWKDHPDRGENPSFEDWRLLIGEVLTEGASMSDTRRYIDAIEAHFQKTFYPKP